MNIDPKHTAFGRHETFPLRYAWLTKGYRAVTERPDIFAQPDRAMVKLGVGRNMVSAILYWLQAARLLDYADGEATPTTLGQVILGDEGDRFLEDEATLWVLHWLIASNSRLATGFYWFFNRFALPRFREDELRAGLTDFVARELRIERSASTLKSDTSTLLRMYAPGDPTEPGRGEDHLDTPMSQLRLVEQTGQGREFLSLRSPRPFLPPLALHVALAECFADDRQGRPAIPVRDLLYGRDDGAAPGAVFRLSEDGLMTALNRVMRTWPGCYELRDTAGVHQLYRVRDVASPEAILEDYYRQDAAA
ncbi:DUF4007 family protein [uncultured Thiohalocapsa sp.]|uniref:DUF4007 family protein n=1 Tax=uncultured Thiohalocapsa sp. TaxID=768990 RepID=UPI0025CFFB04|nr:DUF4007 family protein [uncultured Thiohalocapsa sp.]